MPWPLFSRPSVQVGVLKGFLQKNWPELEVKSFHPYLKVASALGYDLYQKLSETFWIAEALGAALLFPERCPEIKNFCQKKTKGKIPNFDFEKNLATLESSLEACFAEIDWKPFSAIGFSVCLNQLCTSLWGAKWLKRRFPEKPVIFGGSSCAKDLGKSILRLFPEVDFIINGEGEKPLLALLKHLIEGAPKPHKGLFFRKNGTVEGEGFLELNPEELPSPIYDDYLKEVMSLPAEKRFFPTIPLEMSRGCWWFKCSFCNLNLQWHGFRKKALPQVLKEIRAHAQAGLLDFAFMDNCLPVKDSLLLFAELAKDKIDYRFFAELRAVYKRTDYHLMRQGGLTWVQIGIEALSTGVLKKLNKGTTAIENIAAMRHCEEAGLILEGNLILEFPGCCAEEVAETLRNLDFVFPYRPLTTVSFWLGYESHVFKNYQNYGIKAIWPHPYYRYFFPEKILKDFVPLGWSYRGDRAFQRRLWQPVRQKVKRWQKLYHKLTKEKGPLLSYRDGKSFLIIRQVLPNGNVLHHRLKGPSRDIYLFLMDIRSLKELKEKFPNIPETKLKGFLDDLVAKRLLFQENESYLALAIHRRLKE